MQDNVTIGSDFGLWYAHRVVQGQNIYRIYNWPSVQNGLPPGCHHIAVAGFTLSCELVTPYIPRQEGDTLFRLQNHYNFIHSATGMAIECAFGMLKQIFRLFRRKLKQKSIINRTRCILTAMR
ncbi:hypothetical protein PHMEG_0002909 [Phytophthora megakarya]|uniref:DDE Tnp4 domain-containing protein n=1 Tax=Phytophthora megakarya TaxID=4795 RepID=A0A225WXI1_9STRA|nr:hypothetical protein PHMEG_0002909 [Phytophthora megakarya]